MRSRLTEDLFLDITQGDRATIAVLFGLGGEVIGEAHCHPDDKPDAEVGELLAVGRALERAGRRLIRRAEGLVKHADDVRADRERHVEHAGFGTCGACGKRTLRCANCVSFCPGWRHVHTGIHRCRPWEVRAHQEAERRRCVHCGGEVRPCAVGESCPRGGWMHLADNSHYCGPVKRLAEVAQ